MRSLLRRVVSGPNSAPSRHSQRQHDSAWQAAAGIEPYPALFEKRRRRATFVVNWLRGNELESNSLSPPVPWSPLESSPVLER